MNNFRKTTVYQIYPKSFKDSNEDGHGDINGIIEKLDYLEKLGIEYIWMTPFYVSPQVDNGYDVADYCNIDPKFGTMEDFEKLIKEAKRKNIGIMVDLVFNHSSTEHEWFKKAISGDEKYKEFYIFKRPKDSKEPTNWSSKFGGSAWKYVKEFDQYYLHLFDETMADLNWENIELRKELYNIVNFWINKGVKGFRLDVLNYISKPEEYLDDEIGDGGRFYTDGPKIHTYLKEMNENTFGKHNDIVTVGEMASTNVENCIKYTNPEEKELTMVFNFRHLGVDYQRGNKWIPRTFDFMRLKEVFKEWQEGMQEGNGWNALFWCCHDQPRIVSRFGDDTIYHKQSAKMLATVVHLMRGTPYVYQGEEIGMKDAKFTRLNQYKDIESINAYNILIEKGIDEEEALRLVSIKSRDNARTPMQWDDTINAGFSKVEPWIELAESYKEVTVKKALEDNDSIFYHYQKLIRLRKECDIISEGSINMILEDHEEVLGYVRKLRNQKLIVLNNFYKSDIQVNLPKDLICGKNSHILISNYSNSATLRENITLRAYESVAYLINE